MTSGARVAARLRAARSADADPGDTSTRPPQAAVDGDGSDSGPTDPPAEEDPPAETRRERLRRETIEEIKVAARQQLTLESTSQLSLRAVARDVGLTPSAIYRYFESQQELMAAVANDAYASAAAAMRASAAATEGRRADERLRALGHAYRRWAKAHKAEFNLIFSTDQGAFADGPGAVSSATFDEFFAVPVGIYATAVHQGQIDPTTALVTDPVALTPSALRFAERSELGLEALDLNLLLCGWGAFHGFVSLELFGHLDRFYTDPDAAFDTQLTAIVRAMGVVSA